MTGSSLPARACSVRFVANCSSMLSLCWAPRPASPEKKGDPGSRPAAPAPAMGRPCPWSFAVSLSTAACTEAPATPRRFRMSVAMPLPSSTMASSRCSVETYVWLFSRAKRNERSITAMTRGVKASLAASASGCSPGTVARISVSCDRMSS